MVKVKKEVLWLFYYVGLIVIATSAWNYVNYRMRIWAETFEFGPLYLIGILTTLVISLYLSVPHFIRQYSANGSWSFNFIRAGIIGVPFLAVSIMTLGVYNFTAPGLLNELVWYLIIDGLTMGLVLSTVFGYVIFTCIAKKEEDTAFGSNSKQHVL
ncbi:hypothetical protein AB685_10990 [Bacillus sp. LL01]|uniref:hypothetical protein n=1 Tax=Bacillus sp. LL01 TaxID=1665556 RepID=UPI00064D33F3|nr:hypothetical protein [Bacillus sp. LL01]KMJ58410.1 hypothetical protein AB685_10990 [Bacillus sp. LL01]